MYTVLAQAEFAAPIKENGDYRQYFTLNIKLQTAILIVYREHIESVPKLRL